MLSVYSFLGSARFAIVSAACLVFAAIPFTFSKFRGYPHLVFEPYLVPAQLFFLNPF